MSRLSTTPGLAALRETLGIDTDFSTCLALTSRGPNRTNPCLGKLGDKGRKAVQQALEQLSQRFASGSTLSDVDRIVKVLSTKLVCGNNHFPFSHIRQHEWKGQKWETQKTYIQSIIKGCLEEYLLDKRTEQPEANISAPPSDDENTLPASSTPTRVSVVPARPRIRREGEMVDHVPREVTPTKPESPDFESSFAEDIDASFASASTSASEDSLFSPEDASYPSIYSRETTPFDISEAEVMPSEVSEEKTTTHEIPTQPEPPSVIIHSPTQHRRHYREDEKQQIHSVEPDASDLEESLVDLVDNDRPPSSIDAIGRFSRGQGPKKGPKDAQPGEADSNRGTLSSPAQSGLLAPKASLGARRRSVSHLADARPLSTADPESEKIRTVDDENGSSRYKGYTNDQVVRMVSPNGKKPSKDCVASVAYAREMDSDIRHCLGGKMHYFLSSTRATKADPVCDILATMREPINLDYRGGWIYVFSIKAAPGLLKIGLAYKDTDMKGTEKLWDHTTRWGSILPGRLLLNDGGSVPFEVVARLKGIQSQCKLGDFTLEHFMRVPEGVHKAESLIHKTLHKHAQYVSCSCGTQHKEWFYLGLSKALSVVNIWHKFMSSSPYGEHGFIREFWQSRCAGKAAKDHQTTSMEKWFEKSFKGDLLKEASEIAKNDEKALQVERERHRLEEEIRLLEEKNQRLEEENRRREAEELALRKEAERRKREEREEREKQQEKEELMKLKFGRAFPPVSALKRVGTL